MITKSNQRHKGYERCARIPCGKGGSPDVELPLGIAYRLLN